MKKSDYVKIAKAINQRMIRAEKSGQPASEWYKIQSELKKAGFKKTGQYYRLPERVKTIDSSMLEKAVEISSIAKDKKSLRATGVKAVKEKKLSEDELYYVRNSAKINRQLREIENQKISDTIYAYQSISEDISDILGYTQKRPEFPSLSSITPSEMKQLNRVLAVMGNARELTKKGRGKYYDTLVESFRVYNSRNSLHLSSYELSTLAMVFSSTLELGSRKSLSVLPSDVVINLTLDMVDGRDKSKSDYVNNYKAVDKKDRELYEKEMSETSDSERNRIRISRVIRRAYIEWGKMSDDESLKWGSFTRYFQINYT